MHRKTHIEYYFPNVEIKYYNVMIDRRIFFNQLVKMTTYER